MSENQKHSRKLYYIIGVLAVLVVTSFFTIRSLITPTVSVVMPVYNRESLVARAIESILAQTFTDFEFIIVDDGSTDNTSKILNDYAAIDKRIKIIRNETNRGIPFSRNRGIQAARGTYIATMDSDDYSLPDRLAKSVRFMKEHSDVAAMTGNCAVLRPDMKTFPTPKSNMPNDEYKIKHGPGFYEVDLLFYNNFYNVSSMFRRSFIKKHNIAYRYDYKSAEDYDFWFQFVKNGGKLASLDDFVAYARFHSTNSDEYYQALDENSRNLHREAFSMFFYPEESEIQFGYSVFEKCPILSKMLASNKKRHVIDQSYLEKYYENICPSGKGETIKLVHPNWESYLEKTGENQWHRLETDIFANVVKKGNNKITVEWVNFPPENFVFNPTKDVYTYMPHDRKIELIHPYWKDTFWLDEHLSIGCREGSLDCGEYIFSNDNKDLLIKWRGWPPEEFTQTKDGYKFKENKPENKSENKPENEPEKKSDRKKK